METITVSEWNVNGWSYKRSDNDSADFRRNIVISHKSDVYAICETHLRDNNKIAVPGYKWYGHNRTDLNDQAIRCSGGVGFLVSTDALYNYYNTFEGIMWLKLTLQRASEFGVLLCVCYLPPEGSSRGDVGRRHSCPVVAGLKILFTLDINQSISREHM